MALTLGLAVGLCLRRFKLLLFKPLRQITLPNGDTYSGEWLNDAMHGESVGSFYIYTLSSFEPTEDEEKTPQFSLPS